MNHNRDIGISDGMLRKNIYPGLRVRIVLKADQRSGKLTEGVVRDILTNAEYHSRGIKVRLADGKIGRVQQIIDKAVTAWENREKAFLNR